MCDVALGSPDLGHAAALGAFAAVDCRMHFFRGPAELALNEIMRFDPSSEAEVLGASLFP